MNSSCSDHKFHALLGIHNTWWMHNTLMDLIHTDIEFFTKTAKITFLQLLLSLFWWVAAMGKGELYNTAEIFSGKV